MPAAKVAPHSKSSAGVPVASQWSCAVTIDLGCMQVTASSPVCRNTDPKALVSGNFLRMNFAGPRTVEGRPQTWWQLDLGPGCKLTCNYYTLRQDGSQDFLRNWKLQVYLSSAQLDKP